MDPNETLRLIRALVARVNKAHPSQPDAAARWFEVADELATHVSELDDWISYGGFLPAAWDRVRTANGLPLPVVTLHPEPPTEDMLGVLPKAPR
jgi:hypothetical protein